MHTIIMLLSFTGALFLKESSALLLFAMFSAYIVHIWKKGESTRNSIWLLICLVALWSFLAWDLLSGKQTSLVGESSWQERLPVIAFTAWQYLYFVPIPAVLLCYLAWFPKSIHRYTLCAGFILLLLLPSMTHYNHYEAMYYTPLWLSMGFSLLLYAYIFKRAFYANDLHALFALSAQCVMWLAILLSSTPREDMATRIFLPALPSLLIVWSHSIQQVWTV